VRPSRNPAGRTLKPVVVALQAVRGIDLITAVTIIAEIGDLTRFSSARGGTIWQ